MTNAHIVTLIVLGLFLLVWWWIRLMEEYQPDDAPSQYDEEIDFFVFGYNSDEKRSTVVVVSAVNDEDAIEKAKIQYQNCTFGSAIRTDIDWRENITQGQ